MKWQDVRSVSPSPAATGSQTILEVLVEPGGHQVWVTFSTGQSHRIDLSSLLYVETYRALKLNTLFVRVEVSPNGQHLIWPGGAQFDLDSLLNPSSAAFSVETIAVVPSRQRYRPLLPYLVHHLPSIYLHAAPVEANAVQRLLHLRPGELDEILRGVPGVPVPSEPLLNRLYDLGVFLTSYFAPEHLYALMRRPWRYSEQRYPNQPLLHTMLGCLLRGRPDLIEHPCMVLATGK